MFEDWDSPQPHSYINILVTDYVAGHKAMHVSEDAPLDRFACARVDIHLLIDAPGLLSPAQTVGDNVFFLDVRFRDRPVKCDQFQIIYEGAENDRDGFYRWACECAEFFRVMQFNIGMVCVDYADFLTALSLCEGSRLRFEKLAYEHHTRVPQHRHSGSPYRVIYGCLDGGLDLSLAHYQDFVQQLEARNPLLVMMKTAMKMTKSTAYSMMLLGEAQSR